MCGSYNKCYMFTDVAYEIQITVCPVIWCVILQHNFPAIFLHYELPYFVSFAFIICASAA